MQILCSKDIMPFITNTTRPSPPRVLAQPKKTLRSKNPHIQIHAPRRNHTPDTLLPPGIIHLPFIRCARRIPIHGLLLLQVLLLGALHHPRRPADTAYEMGMRVIEGLDALRLLRQIPAAERFVIAHAQQILAPRMEHECADPIIVAPQRSNQRAARIPYLDRFIPRPCREEFPRAAGGRGFFEGGQAGEMWVAGRGREDAAFDHVLVVQEGRFCFSGRGVP